MTAAGIITSLFFSLMVFWEMREQPYRLLDSDLKTVAGIVAGQLERQVPPAALSRHLQLLGDRYWIRVYDGESQVVLQAGLAAQVELPPGAAKKYNYTTRVSRRKIFLGQDEDDRVIFRVRQVEVTAAGRRYTVQVARPMQKLDEEIVEVLTFLGYGLLFSLLFLLALSYYVAGRILEPLQEINALARRINEDTLGQRLSLARSGDELAELAASLNQMFTRLNASFVRRKQLLANAAHELKTPLATLRLFFAEAMQRPDLPAELSQQMRRQHDAVCRLDHLVRNLLKLSTLEAREELAAADFVALGPLVAEVLADFQPVTTARRLEVAVVVPPDLSCRGDREMLRRLLINLIDNAVKYNFPGGRIELRVAAAPPRWLRLEVYNTGPGIPAADLERIFEQFYRVEKSRSAAAGGSGLGLAIVRQIVRLHGGRVEVKSREGEWTRFTILLPV